MTVNYNRPDLIAQLAEGVANLTTSEHWERHLAFQGRFHRYSFGNVLLIAAQRPEATRVAGFHAWRRLERTVRKGEKALWILAPMVSKRSVESETDDERERVLRGFKFVPVFDVAQTDGPALPSPCQRLSGDDPEDYFGQLVAAAHGLGFSVEDHTFVGTTNGDCSHGEHRIRVAVGNSPAQRVKTLAHELAHAILHETSTDRPLAELEAESTAYVVCQSLDVDSSDYSFGYVATWAGGGDEAIAGIKASGDRIQKTAAVILQSVVVGEAQGARAA